MTDQHALHNIRFFGPMPSHFQTILTPEALSFVAKLTRQFAGTIDALLAARQARQAEFDKGVLPNFLPETRQIREGEWSCAALPADLLDRRVEITGPTDRKMIINALNSGASVFMADFEDSSTPTWENVLAGQLNLRDAVRKEIHHIETENGKCYELNAKIAMLMVRPRGLHLLEKHLSVDDKPVPASIFDFAVFLYHNAKTLIANGSGPYFYLPKLQSHLEARLWNDIFTQSEHALGLPTACIRATVLIETLPAAFEMNEILYELRSRAAGLNCGRWDYIFSYIKTLRERKEAVLPDRQQVTMEQPCMRAYSQLLVQTCHRRGVHAMGGMAAQIPIKGNQQANDEAIAKVKADKLREVKNGHDGTCVAHPGLVPVARAVFDEYMPAPNQIGKSFPNVHVTAAQLLETPAGTRTREGLTHSIRVGVQYLQSWLRGQGCVPLYHLMEDAATAEIARAQIWQWMHHGVQLSDGTPVTKELVVSILNGEVDPRADSTSARDLFLQVSTSTQLLDFLTVPAYDKILASEKSGGDIQRFADVKRPYTDEDVKRLRSTVHIEYSLARRGAERLWRDLHSEPYIAALGAITGNQAVQQARAGLGAIYCSGWQVAADGNMAMHTYPDQSLYPSNSVPEVVRRMNQALLRADQIEHAEGLPARDWVIPIVADAEAGFGGPLNAFELMKAMIVAGAAGVHFEDQLSSEKKCGHMGGKVLIPTSHFVRTLVAARLAADVMDVPTVLIARTDADSARLLTSDVDERDRRFLTGKRTVEGFFEIKGGLDYAIARALVYAPYADVLWCETSTPDLQDAKRFAEAVLAEHPRKLLAYNCSPSFNWKRHLGDADIAKFQQELGRMGYKFQFVTLAGFHSLNHGMFELASDYRESGMTAYSRLQQAEFGAEAKGYSAVKHQREVGSGYFDDVLQVISGGLSSTTALADSTERHQF